LTVRLGALRAGLSAAELAWLDHPNGHPPLVRPPLPFMHALPSE